jgi:hypothetical protein
MNRIILPSEAEGETLQRQAKEYLPSIRGRGHPGVGLLPKVQLLA